MVNRRHVYVGHMFSDGVTILDAADPRRLKPVGFFTAGVNTRTHHLQVADDLLLLANGANIVAMQSYDNLRGYFENALADSITNRKKFRSGLSIHDISKPGEMREIAFLEMPGFGINRLWWTGGRYAYRLRAFRRLHRSHPLHRRSAGHHQAGDRLALVAARHASRGRRDADARAGQARRAASHDRRRRSRRMARGATAASRSTTSAIRATPKLLSHINWSPPFPGGTHTPLPLPGPQPRRRRRRSQRGEVRQGHVPHVHRRRARAGESGADRDAADADGTATSARRARSVRTTCTRTGPDRSAAKRRSSRPTTTPACVCSTSGTRSRRRKSRRGCRRRRRG